MIKLITLSVLLFTSFSYAAVEYQLIPGRYETEQRYICSMSAVQNENEIILEAINDRPGSRTYCTDAGSINRYKKTAPNLYFNSETNVSLEVLGPKNFIVSGHYRSFYKLYEVPAYSKITTDIRNKTIDLYSEGGLEHVFYQGLAGIGSCRILVCKNGDYLLGKFKSDFLLSNCKASANPSKIIFGNEEANAAHLLYTEIDLYGGCDFLD